MKRNKKNRIPIYQPTIIKKSSLILIFILSTALLMIGCKKQNEETSVSTITPNPITENSGPSVSVPESRPEPTVSEPSNVDLSGAVINNGGLFVTYKENIYYRQYNAESYEATGLFGSYNPTINTGKNMMCLYKDGTAKAIFQDYGEGPIFICNDKMYLQRPADNNESILYSIDLDGKNQIELGNGSMEGFDDTTGILVCLMRDANDIDQLSTIQCSSQEIKKLTLSIPCSEVLAVRNGFIYYKGEVSYEESAYGKMKLCKVAIDGSQEMLLAETAGDLYEYESYGTEIPCIQFVNDIIYFSYGGYAGTGYFYQGGMIARVNTDGSNFEILLGTDKEIDGVYSNLVAETFYVVSEGDRNILYYSGQSDSEVPPPKALDLSTMQIATSDFPIFAEGKPFEYDGGVSIYKNASSTMTTLIPAVDYSSLGPENSNFLYTIKQIEICDNWVYYQLEANEYSSEASIGWRDGYQRIKTQILRKEINIENGKILYEY